MSTSPSDTFDHQLHQLAHAYDVHPKLDAIADAIIRQTSIGGGGKTDREAVIGVLALLLEHPGSLSAVAGQGAVPESLYDAMKAAIRSNDPGMPEGPRLRFVLWDISHRLRRHRDVTES